MPTKRGRILKYTQQGEGIVSVEGTQFHFTIEENWKSDVVPLLNAVVDCSFDDTGALVSMTSVSDDIIIKEKQ